MRKKLVKSANDQEHPTIPPRGFVRLVGGLVFLASIWVLFVVATNFSAIGIGIAILAIVGAVITTGASVMAMISGDPEWILLNLIFWY